MKQKKVQSNFDWTFCCTLRSNLKITSYDKSTYQILHTDEVYYTKFC